MRKKKIFFIMLLIIVMLILPIFCIKTIDAKNAVLTKNKSGTTIENDEALNYSKEYLQWLQLSDEEKSKYDIIPRKYDIPLDSIYEDTVVVKEVPTLFNLFGLLSKEKIVSEYAELIPETFDLRNKISISRKNQGNYGLCWAFSGMRTLETNLKINGYGDYDFSELHLDYLTSNEIDKSSDRTLHGGGNFWQFEEYAFNNDGPVLEETVPYWESYTTDEYSYLDNLKNEAYLIESVNFPTIDKKNKTYTDEELELFRSKVKKHIMQNGAVYISVYAGLFRYSDTCQKYTLYNTTSAVNHAINVIGWDDTFSKENFLDHNGNKPTKDGAYIAINSWGNLQEIIYISYEDYTVEREMSGVVILTNDINEVETITTNFKDKVLYDKMKTVLKKSIVSTNEAELSITYLKNGNSIKVEIEGENISDCSGLEDFKFYELKMINCGITDITFLENSSNLISLNLSFNKIKEIGILKKLKNLEEANISNNEITSISSLAELTKIRVLNISNNQISDINSLNPNCNLWNLWLSGNKVRDINILSNFTTLTILYIDNNPIDNISAIVPLKNIFTLNLSDTQIRDIVVLTNLTKLKNLYLNNNQITDITPLSDLTNLTTLYLNNNKIEDISSIDKLTNLTYLGIRNNKIDKEVIIEEGNTAILEVPQIIRAAQDKNSIIYSSLGFKLNNCIWNEDRSGIIVDINNGLNAGVQIESGNASKTQFNITIKNDVVSVKIRNLPRREYFRGEELDLAEGKITLTYRDGSIQEIEMSDNKVNVSGYDKNIIGNQTITVTYEGKTTTFDVTVHEVELSKIEIIQEPTNKNYIEGQNFDKTGMKVKAIYNNGTQNEITDYTIIDGENLTIDKKYVTISYTENGITQTTIQAILVKVKLHITAEEYIIQGKYIVKIQPRVTAWKLKENIQSNIEYEVIDSKGNVVVQTSFVGTGFKIRTVDGQEYELIIWGDFTGDGQISVAELARTSMLAVQGNKTELKEKLIMDVSMNGIIDTSDLAAISRLAVQ